MCLPANNLTRDVSNVTVEGKNDYHVTGSTSTRAGQSFRPNESRHRSPKFHDPKPYPVPPSPGINKRVAQTTTTTKLNRTKKPARKFHRNTTDRCGCGALRSYPLSDTVRRNTAERLFCSHHKPTLWPVFFPPLLCVAIVKFDDFPGPGGGALPKRQKFNKL